MKLATVETITVSPHPNADRLDLVKVLGFQCVTQKGLHETGKKIIYVRPDTVLPDLPWSEGYRKYSPTRVKAVNLRKEWSEGIIVTFDQVSDLIDENDYVIGDDVSDKIGVTKYEPPVPIEPGSIGYLPFDIPETEEERWENLVATDKIPFGEKGDIWLKLDGVSMTAYDHAILTEEGSIDIVSGVCGRRLEYDKESGNKYARAYKEHDIERKLNEYCTTTGYDIAIRGELFDGKFYMFSVYDIDAREYARVGSPIYFPLVAQELGLPTVPLIDSEVTITQELIDYYSTGIKTLNGVRFEGVVIQHKEGSFKIINKFYDSEK